MVEKKKLKKLVLKKEEIVNLNDFQMGQAKGGGSSAKCVSFVLESLSAVVDASIAGYNLGKEESWWKCGGMGDISKKIVNLPDGSQACEIPEFEVYGYRP